MQDGLNYLKKKKVKDHKIQGWWMKKIANKKSI